MAEDYVSNKGYGTTPTLPKQSYQIGSNHPNHAPYPHSLSRQNPPNPRSLSSHQTRHNPPNNSPNYQSDLVIIKGRMDKIMEGRSDETLRETLDATLKLTKNGKDDYTNIKSKRLIMPEDYVYPSVSNKGYRTALTLHIQSYQIGLNHPDHTPNRHRLSRQNTPNPRNLSHQSTAYLHSLSHQTRHNPQSHSPNYQSDLLIMKERLDEMMKGVPDKTPEKTIDEKLELTEIGKENKTNIKSKTDIMAKDYIYLTVSNEGYRPTSPIQSYQIGLNHPK